MTSKRHVLVFRICTVCQSVWSKPPTDWTNCCNEMSDCCTRRPDSHNNNSIPPQLLPLHRPFLIKLQHNSDIAQRRNIIVFSGCRSHADKHHMILEHPWHESLVSADDGTELYKLKCHPWAAWVLTPVNPSYVTIHSCWDTSGDKLFGSIAKIFTQDDSHST